MVVEAPFNRDLHDLTALRKAKLGKTKETRSVGNSRNVLNGLHWLMVTAGRGTVAEAGLR